MSRQWKCTEYDEENFKEDILNPEVRYSLERGGGKKERKKEGKKIAMKISIPFHWEDSATAMVDKFFETFVTNRGIEMK